MTSSRGWGRCSEFVGLGGRVQGTEKTWKMTKKGKKSEISRRLWDLETLSRGEGVANSRPSPGNRNMFHVHRWDSSDFFQVPESIYRRRDRDFFKSEGLYRGLEIGIFSKSHGLYRGDEIGIFPSPRNMKKIRRIMKDIIMKNMKKIWTNLKYEENMKKY